MNRRTSRPRRDRHVEEPPLRQKVRLARTYQFSPGDRQVNLLDAQRLPHGGAHPEAGGVKHR